nr:immunoglobulin heavy chain junction region [Mus musculus]
YYCARQGLLLPSD